LSSPTVVRTPRLWLIALLAFATAALLSPSVAAASHGGSHAQARGGAVYSQTNAAPVNEVVVFARAARGTIREIQRVPTGGAGATSTPPFAFPITDSQGAVELTADRRLLFAVNAGSDTISSFRVGPRGTLTLVDQEASGGRLPVSVDSSRGVLYVLNELSGTIGGFYYNSNGYMVPIPGSTESLSTPGPNGISAQVGFDARGRGLTVTLRGTNTIDTFALGADDTPGPVRSNPSTGPTPFGFAYDRRNTLVVANAGVVGNPPNPMDPSQFVGSGSSYRNASGELTPRDVTAADGRATCWVVITRNGRYAFMTNTLSSSVSRFLITRSQQLRRLGTTATTSQGGAADMAFSRDDRYLYVLSALEPISGPMTSSFDVYRVGRRGSLRHVQSTPSNLPVGMSGLAAY
jgi:6-phosphogluconolactonase